MPDTNNTIYTKLQHKRSAMDIVRMRDSADGQKPHKPASWRPCSFTGIAAANFRRADHNLENHHHVVDVLLGDRVHVYEQNGEWLRGVVGFQQSSDSSQQCSLHVKDRRVREFLRAFQTDQFVDGNKKNGALENSAALRCRLGIFPRNIIHIAQPVVDNKTSKVVPQIASSFETSDCLWHWKDLAFNAFALKRELEYDNVRKVIVEVAELCKRVFQQLELITEAERRRLLAEVHRRIDNINDQLKADVAARDNAADMQHDDTLIEPSECSVVRLYAAYKNKLPGNSALHAKSLFLIADRRPIDSISIFSPSRQPSVHLPSTTTHSVRSPIYDIIFKICRIKWSNFVLGLHHGSTASSATKMHKSSASSSSHDTLAAVTSDSVGNYISLEFATALYDAKTCVYITEPIRHTVKLPLNKLHENSAAAAGDITDRLHSNFDSVMQLDMVFAGLSAHDFSEMKKPDSSIHVVIIVSRIFGDINPLDCLRDDGSVPNSPSTPNAVTSAVKSSLCSVDAEHNYSAIRIVIGCAVSRHLSSIFSLSPADQQVVAGDNRFLIFSAAKPVDVKTARGIETLTPAASLSYYSLDVLPAKEKPNVYRLLQYVLRQPRFSTQQQTTGVMYMTTNISSLPNVEVTASDSCTQSSSLQFSKSDTSSNQLCGGSTVVTKAAVDTGLYFLHANSAGRDVQQNFEPLEAEREKEMDFVITWKTAISNSTNQISDCLQLDRFNFMPISRKTTLDKFALPDDYRSDVYVTIKSLDVHIFQHSKLSAGLSLEQIAASGQSFSLNDQIPALPKNFQPNVEILLSVCDRVGRIIKGAIALPSEQYGFEGLSRRNSVHYVSYYASAVYWKDDNPIWSETVRLSLSPSQLTKAHLRFVVRLRSTKHTKRQPQQFFPSILQNGSEKSNSKSTSSPKLKYFSSSTTETVAKSPNGILSPSSLLSAPLKNDLILGVAYLPLSTAETGCVVKSDSYDLFVHRFMGGGADAEDADSPSHNSKTPHSLVDRGSKLFNTGRRLLKSRPTLFGNNKTSAGGRNSGSSHRSVSPSTRARSSTTASAASAAKRSSSPSIASLISVDENQLSTADNATMLSTRSSSPPPMPPPRHHHHLHTSPCELDTDYMTLPADQSHYDMLCSTYLRRDSAVDRKSSIDALSASESNKDDKDGTLVTSKITTVMHEQQQPNGAVVADSSKHRASKHIFAGISIPSFGKGSKKKVSPAAEDAATSPVNSQQHLSVDLAAGDVIVPNGVDTGAETSPSAAHRASAPVVFSRGVYATSSKDRLEVHISVCCTKAVQNRQLLGLFKHGQNTIAREETEKCLKTLISMPQQPVLVEFHEILQLLPDIFDALFGILLAKSTNDAVCDNLQLLAFKAILHVIALFGSEKNRRFMSSLEYYLRQHFYFPLAHRQLLKIIEFIADACIESESAGRDAGRNGIGATRSCSKISMTDKDDTSEATAAWGALARQRSSRSSIFYTDFPSVDEDDAQVEQQQHVATGRRSADVLRSSSSWDFLDDGAGKKSVQSGPGERIVEKNCVTAVNLGDLFSDTIKYLPYLFAFTITSYLQHESHKAELLSVADGDGMRSLISSPTNADSSTSPRPTPPPRTTSRTSSRNSKILTPTPARVASVIATAVEHAEPQPPPYDIAQQISFLLNNKFFRLVQAGGGQSAVVWYQTLLSVLPDCIDTLSIVCSAEQLFVIIEQQLRVASPRLNVMMMSERRRSSTGQSSSQQQFFRTSSGTEKRKSRQVFFSPAQLLSLSTARLTFLRNLLTSKNYFLASLLSCNPASFLNNVDKLCDVIVEDLDVSRANVSVINSCGSVIMLLLETNDECEQVRNAALPRRRVRVENGDGSDAVRSFADLLVVRFFPVVVETILHLIKSRIQNVIDNDDDDYTSSAAEVDTRLDDFLVILMSLLRYMNGRSLQAALLSAVNVESQPTVYEEAAVDISRLREYIMSKVIVLVKQLLDYDTFFSVRWSLMVLEQCKYIHKFLLQLVRVMKKYFLPAPTSKLPSSTDADNENRRQPKKRHECAPSVRPASSILDDNEEAGDDGSNTVVSAEIMPIDNGENDADGAELEDETFDVEIWIAFINCCVKFCLAKPLQIDPLTTLNDAVVALGENKVLKTVFAYGDMRLSMSSTLHSLWYSFGKHRPSFIPGVVNDVLRLSLIPDPAVRARIIPLFFDMMQQEFYTMISVPYDVDDEAVDYVYRRQCLRRRQLKLLKQQKGNRNSLDDGDESSNNNNAAEHVEMNHDELDDDADDIDMYFENDNEDDDDEQQQHISAGTRRIIKTNFNLFTLEIITRIDELFDAGFGDWTYLRQFRDAISIPLDAGNSQSKIYDGATDLIERLCTQMELLLRYREKFTVVADRSASNSNNSGDVYSKMACTFAVMDFYDQIERRELYIRYLYRLRDLHLQHNDFTEIAFTLEHHAKLLAWSDEPLPEQLQPIPPLVVNEEAVERRPLFFTHRQLKEDLFREMIECFERSKLWELGIQMCKELAGLFENDLYDYESLSQILKKQASLFENIVEQGDSRPVSNYFYVGFWGNGFDAAFRNLHFIYRGAPFESLMQFQQRMRERFPQAELLTSMNEPADDVKDGDDTKQYLQICRVEPVSDHLIYAGGASATLCGDDDDGGVADRLAQGRGAKSAAQQTTTQHMSWKIRKFYEHNEVSMFTYSQVVKNPTQNEASKSTKKSTENPAMQFARMWIERTTFATKTTLPHLLRWSEVRYHSKNVISPCKTAVENLQAKSRHVTLLAEKQVDALQHKLKTMQRTSLAEVSGRSITFSDAAGTLTAARSAVIKTSMNKQTSTDIPSGTAASGQRSGSVVLIQEFTQTLLGVLDPAVQGGIPMYEQAFLSSENNGECGPIDPTDTEALKSAIAETVPILEVALTVHEVAMRASGATVQQQQTGLHEHLVEKFNRFKSSTYAKYGQRTMPTLMLRLLKDAINAHNAFDLPSAAVASSSRVLRKKSAPAFADDVPYANSAVTDGRAPLHQRNRSSTNATTDSITTQSSGSRNSKVKMRNNSLILSSKTESPTIRSGANVRHSAATSGYVSASPAVGGAKNLRRPVSGFAGSRLPQQQNATLTSAQSFISANNVYSTSVISDTKKNGKNSGQQQQKSASGANSKSSSSLRKRRAGAPSTAVTESSSSSGPAGSKDLSSQFGTLTRKIKVRESITRVIDRAKQTQAGTAVLSTFKRHLSNAGTVGNTMENQRAYYYDTDAGTQAQSQQPADDKNDLSMLTPNRLHNILGSSSALSNVAVSADASPRDLNPNRNRRRNSSLLPINTRLSTTATPSTITAAVSSSSSSSNTSNLKKIGAVRTNNPDQFAVVSAVQTAGSRVSIAATACAAPAEVDNDDGISLVSSNSQQTVEQLISDVFKPPQLPPKGTVADVASLPIASAPPPPPPAPPITGASQRSSSKPPIAAKPASLTNSQERLSRLQQSQQKPNGHAGSTASPANTSVNATEAAAQLPPLPDKVRVRTRTAPGVRSSAGSK